MVATSSAHLEIPDQALMTANGKPHHAHAHTSAPLPADVDETPPSESFPPFDTMFSARPRVVLEMPQHSVRNTARHMCLNTQHDFNHEMRLQNNPTQDPRAADPTAERSEATMRL